MEEEILDVVDENDRFVGKTTRKEVREKVLMHRVSRVIIKNSENKFLIQKRAATKKMFPSHFDVGIAETVKSGGGYVGAGMRGLMEELGIFGISNIQLMHSFLFKIKYSSLQINEHCKVYQIVYDGKLTVQQEEIDDIRLLEIEDIKKLMREMPFHPIGKVVFEKYLEEKWAK